MRWILLLIAVLLLWACADYDVDFYDDAASRSKTIYPLKNRALSLSVQHERVVFGDSIEYVYAFEPHSVKLFGLDSLLNVVDGKEAQCDVDGHSCDFGSRDYDYPFVKLVVYGEWSKNGGVATSGQMEYWIDIGQDDVVPMLDLKYAFSSSRLFYYMSEEGLPYYMAKVLAQKDMDRSYDGTIAGQMPLWMSVHFDDQDFEKEFKTVVNEYGKSLQLKIDELKLADFVLENYSDGCGAYNDACIRAYGLNTCSSEYYVDTISNERSKFNGFTLVCNKSSGWKLYDGQADSLPLCSTFQDDLVYESGSSSFLICKEGGWEECSFSMENRKYLLGDCADNEVRTILWRYFYCRNGEWMDASQLDYDIGICGVTIEYGQMFEYNDTVAVCKYSVSDYSETAGGITLSYSRFDYEPTTWHWANSIEASTFRKGLVCNRESDSLQLAQFDGQYYGCFDDGKSYQWIKLDQSIGLVSYYVEKTDSSNREMYGQFKEGLFYVSSDKTDLDYKNVRYVYNNKDSHLYGAIVLNDKIWLDTALTTMGNGRWEDSERRCPDGFHIPSMNEWASYISAVKGGNAKAMLCDTTSIEAVVFKTSTPAIDDLNIALYFAGKYGVTSASTMVYPKNEKTAIACVRDF